MIPLPSAASSRINAKISSFAPDVHALRGLVEDQHPAAPMQPFGKHDLLLVAAGQSPYLALEPGGHDVEARRDASGSLSLAGAPRERKHSGKTVRLERRERDVLADTEVENEAFVATILRQKRDPAANGVGRVAETNWAAVDFDRAGRWLVGAADHPRRLRPPRTDEPGKPEDLARVQLERDVRSPPEGG